MLYIFVWSEWLGNSHIYTNTQSTFTYINNTNKDTDTYNKTGVYKLNVIIVKPYKGVFFLKKGKN